MSTYRMSRRDMLKSLALLAMGSALGTATSACGIREQETLTAEPPAETGEAPVPKPVSFTFSAGGAGPQMGQESGSALQTIVDAYRELHPNVQIEWYYHPEGVAMGEWLTARMAAQDCPDIFWSLPEDLWPHINKGWGLPFDDQMDLPNPYVDGNTRWKDQFLDVAINYATGPDGKLYSAIMDAVGVMILYNREAFGKIGYDPGERWVWDDFIGACEELKQAGYVPIAGDLSYDNWYPEWMTEPNLNQFIWDTVFQWDDDGNRIISTKEVAIHLQKGDFPDWEADLQTSKLLKATVPYLPEGWEGQLDLNQLFRQEACAMWYTGSWMSVSFHDDPPPFEFGWVDAPILTPKNFPGIAEKVIRIFGAWGRTNWHIPGYLAQTAPEKVEVAFDLLKFISVPDNVTLLCAEASMLATVKGAKSSPTLDEFTRPYDRATPYQGWENLTEDAYLKQLELWQAYLPSDMSDEEYLELAKAKLDEALRLVLEQNPDWEI